MDVILIKDLVVENVIAADSLERAQIFYPGYIVKERTLEILNVSQGYTYDPEFDTFTAPPDPEPIPEDRKITRLAFSDRFTDAEAIGLDLASIGATVPAASIRRYMSKVNSATYIDLSRSDTRAGVLALEAGGLIAPGRGLEILDNPIQPKERYIGVDS